MADFFLLHFLLLYTTVIYKGLLEAYVIQILQVMAEDSDDGFNPEVMKLGKKNEMEKLRMGVDSSEEVINEFKFLTQEEVN